MWLVWLTLIVSLGLGAGIGYGAQRWSRIGVLLIAVWIGGIVGSSLYVLVFHMLAEDNPMLVLWLCIACCSVLVAVLSMIYFDHAVIIGSAMGGSYCFIRVSRFH